MSENKDINYSLSNVENYKKELDANIEEIIAKYATLIIDYYKFIIENIKVKNRGYVTFIIIRGLDTITHVFLNLLLYTKNIDLTYFHCQKSFYFYVEFVGQISEDDKMFLQLTSRDAVTYVYKKTIFEISNELKKQKLLNDITKTNMNIIDSYVKIYKLLLQKIIVNLNSHKNQEHNLHCLENIYENLNFNLHNKSKIKEIENITIKLYEIIEENAIFLEIIQQIIKKFVKNQDIVNKITSNKFIDNQILNEKLQETPEKFILWLLS